MKEVLNQKQLQLMILINRIFLIFSSVFLLIEPFYIRKSYDHFHTLSNITKEHLFYDKINSDISLRILFVFFLILSICFLFLKYKQHYFEFALLSYLPILIYAGIKWIFPSVKISGEPYIVYELSLSYFILLLAIITNILVMIYLWKIDMLDIPFLDFLDTKNSNNNYKFKTNKDDLELQRITELKKEKNYQILALFLFLILPIASNLATFLPYNFLNALQNNFEKINEAQFIQTIGIPHYFSNEISLTLDLMIIILSIEFILLFTLLCLFYNKFSIIIEKIKENNFLFFISIVFLGFLLFMSLFGSLGGERIYLLIIDIIFRPFLVFLVFPFFLIPIFMYDKKIRDPKLAREGLIIILCYSIMVICSLYIKMWLPLDITISEFDILLNSDLRPTMIIFFIPFLARALWTENND